MKKVILSFIVMALSAITINAKGTIKITNLSFEPGETKTLSIEINDETAYCGFQIDLVLPEGFSIPEVLNEDEEYVKDITLDPARKKSSHTLSYNEIGDAIRIVSYSNTNATYKETSGALINIAVTASKNITAGNYSVELRNIEFTTPDEIAVHFDNIAADLEVKKTTNDDTEGTINLTNLSFEPGETKTLSVEINDETAYCGFQMDLVLPEGFSIPEVLNEDEEYVKDITLDPARKKSSHTLSYNEIGNAIRIVSYSNTNATYKGTSGALVNIAVTASKNITAGNYSVELRNIEFTTPDEAATNFDNIISNFTVAGGGGEIPINYTATVKCGPEGDAMLSANYIAKGSPLKLLIAPNNGYRVSSLLLNGNAVNIKNNVYNIASVVENLSFDIAFEAIVPDTIEIEKIVTDTIEIEKIITDSIFVEVIDTLVVEKIITDTIEIETIETDTIYIAEINEVPTPEITFADGTMSISCALKGTKIFYSTDGTFPTQEYTVPITINEDCVVMAIAVVASKETSMKIVGTSIGGGSIVDEIVFCRYFTETGVEIEEPREGVNIMIIKYASGKTETKKVVVRKK